MRLYPDLPHPRRRTFARDAAVVLVILTCAALGLWVHHSVDRLGRLGHGVKLAGQTVQTGFQSAGDAAQGLPLVGGLVSDALHRAGAGSGGAVAAEGSAGESSAHRSAWILGALVWLLPSATALAIALPGRLRQVRLMREAETALTEGPAGARIRLLATRAALTLPAEALLRHTPDPIADLDDGRYAPLVAAALDDLGLRGPPRRAQ